MRRGLESASSLDTHNHFVRYPFNSQAFTLDYCRFSHSVFVLAISTRFRDDQDRSAESPRKGKKGENFLLFLLFLSLSQLDPQINLNTSGSTSRPSQPSRLPVLCLHARLVLAFPFSLTLRFDDGSTLPLTSSRLPSYGSLRERFAIRLLLVQGVGTARGRRETNNSKWEA